MDSAERESRITAAFVAVADTLVNDFDEVDLLHTLLRDCVEIVGMDAGGLLLADPTGDLQLLTSTDGAAEFIEVMQLAADSGPCIDAYSQGAAVSVADIADNDNRWPEFTRAALAQGMHSVLATPMKLRGKVIGSMNLFGQNVGRVSERDAAVAQALADVATIGLVQERLLRESSIIEEQLHRALSSRVVIEQAKGVIASSLSVTMEEAFKLIRTYSRNQNLTVRAAAEAVSDRRLGAQEVASLAAGKVPH